jgi:hypothetical protein
MWTPIEQAQWYISKSGRHLDLVFLLFDMHPLCQSRIARNKVMLFKNLSLRRTS